MIQKKFEITFREALFGFSDTILSFLFFFKRKYDYRQITEKRISLILRNAIVKEIDYTSNANISFDCIDEIIKISEKGEVKNKIY